MAVELARSCRPDVLIIRGSNAGGYGLVKSCSIKSLLPECSDTLEEGFGHIPLIGAGGIMDGRGVAAAITLGADGVCLVTPFLASPDAIIGKGYQDDVIKAKDGRISTGRTSLYDRLRGTPGWPKIFDGRGLLNQSFLDHEKGMDEVKNTKLYEEAIKLGDAVWGEQGRITTYAGTGVGLVHRSIPAAEIVAELLRDSKEQLAKAPSRFQTTNERNQTKPRSQPQLAQNNSPK